MNRPCLLALLLASSLARAGDPPKPVSESDAAALISVVAGAATSASASDARRRLLESVDPATVLTLLRARGVGSGDWQARWAMVSCDLLVDLLEQRAAAGQASPGMAQQLVEVLDLDLHGGLGELPLALAALPRGEAVAALTSRIAGGSAQGRARSVRMLGEMLPVAGGPDPAPQLLALLRDGQADVRFAAVLALEALDRSADPLPAAAPLASVAALVSDTDPRVACEALRICGERSLVEAREMAETLARRESAPLEVRARAIVTLGVLRQPASLTTLRMLLAVEKPPEVSRLACWSLCALGDVASRPQILRRVERADPTQEATLFYALGRLGALEDLAGILAGGDSLQARTRANRALRGLARASCAPDPQALKAAVDLLVKWYHDADADPTPDDLQGMVRSLLDLDLLTPGRAPVATAAVAELLLEKPETSFEIMLLRALALMGPPADADLARRLTEHLARRLTGPSTSRTYTQMVGNGLASVDPEAARVALRAYLDDLGPNVRGLARVVARSLARAGDRTVIEQHALPLSREELASAPNVAAQFGALVEVGSDLLEAGRWDEALVELRRVRRAAPWEWWPLWNIGCAHVLAGRTELGWYAVRRALRNLGDPLELAADPDLAPFRSDPRFKRAVARLALQWETGMPPPQDHWGPPTPPPATHTGGG